MDLFHADDRGGMVRRITENHAGYPCGGYNPDKSGNSGTAHGVRVNIEQPVCSGHGGRGLESSGLIVHHCEHDSGNTIQVIYASKINRL
jgi:hypothetical protein